MDDLKTLRSLAGFTQHKAARAAGIARSRLSEIECGDVVIAPEEESRLRRVLLRAIETRSAQIEGALSATGIAESADHSTR
jgi:transcriptional regulator with XRE-family HTH domain